ncbi:MAG: TM2 domain-containing protein [Actinomycetota bacterium]
MNNLPVSYLLWAACFFGPFGLHRLYNGKVATGLLWLCTFGLLGMGQLFDLLLIPNMVAEHNAKVREQLGVSPVGVPIYYPNAAIAATVHQPTREQLMVKLLKAASSKGGKLSVTQGVMATGASFSEVEAALKEMLKTGYVSIGNDPVSGIVLYDFHEL